MNVLPTSVVAGSRASVDDSFLKDVQGVPHQSPVQNPAITSQNQSNTDANVLLSEGRPNNQSTQNFASSGTTADGQFSLVGSNGEYATAPASSFPEVSKPQISLSVSVAPLFARLDEDKIVALDNIFGNV